MTEILTGVCSKKKAIDYIERGLAAGNASSG